jgi:hypothetical protein
LLTGVVVSIAIAAGVGERGALLAGLVWALHPALVTSDNLILTECVFNACCLGGMVAAMQARSARGWLLAGLLLGYGTLVRPLGLLYLPAACALAWKHTAIRWRMVLTITCLTVMPSALWSIRNRTVGEGMRITSVADLDLLYCLAGYAISEERGEDWLETWPQRITELSQRLRQRLQPGEDVVTAARHLAIEECRVRPVAVLRVCAKSSFKLFVGHSLGSMVELLGMPYQPSGIVSRLLLREQAPGAGGSWPILAAALAWATLNVIIFVSSLVGFVLALRCRNWCLVVVGGLITVLFTAATAAVGLERFRIPIMLPLLLLAGNAWSALLSRHAAGATILPPGLK